MSNLFTTTESGALRARTRFKNRDFRKGLPIEFARAYPVYADFVLPSDINKISYDMLLRLMPMKAPLLNNINARIRFGFVPLRLVEENADLVITGSKDGKYDSEVVIPEFQNIWQWLYDCSQLSSTSSDHWNDNTTITVSKNDFLHILFGLDVGQYTYKNVKNDESAPAAYWVKGYARFWWDYYRDENLSNYLNTSSGEFDQFLLSLGTTLSYNLKNNVVTNPFIVYRKKDYFTSSLPWQLKGVAPRIDIDFQSSSTWWATLASSGIPTTTIQANNLTDSYAPFVVGDDSHFSKSFTNALNNALSSGNTGISAEQIRDVMAETRILERLARTGSRYTEYLRSNFGTSPADGTLQRSVYLGGGKIPIITSEVLQTAGDSDNNPVGTMRGHGIARSGNKISTCSFKEFGMLFGILDVMPQTVYMQGVSRRFSYKSRWQFFNPTFQHLSEQVIRAGEVMYSDDGKNDMEWGYTEIYNELRVGETKFLGDLQDNLAYWNQAIAWPSRPVSINDAFIRSYNSNNMRPFTVTDVTLAKPIIADVYIHNDSYRPMVRYGTPGFNDHF